MTRIIIRGSDPAYWNPNERAIVLPREGIGYTPFILGHEIAHVRLGHGLEGSSALTLYEERDAWRETLRRALPGEIDLRLVKQSMQSYLEDVGYEWGFESRQYTYAKKLVRDLLAYAKRRKKEGK